MAKIAMQQFYQHLKEQEEQSQREIEGKEERERETDRDAHTKQTHNSVARFTSPRAFGDRRGWKAVKALPLSDQRKVQG